VRHLLRVITALIVSAPAILLILLLDFLPQAVKLFTVGILIYVGMLFLDRDELYIDLARSSAWALEIGPQGKWFTVPLRNAPHKVRGVCVDRIGESEPSPFCWTVLLSTREVIMNPLLAVEVRNKMGGAH
jgi:hypothetical protein